MAMAELKFEICQLREILRGTPPLTIVITYIAESANKAIAKSREATWYVFQSHAAFEKLRSELHQEVLSQLLANGWEPFGTDDQGRFMAFRRSLTGIDNSKTETSTSREAEERLKGLERLRAKRLITEEEYKRKRDEILSDL
jgi:hypothetical protein